ncbi:MAG: Inner-membrane translocator [Thermotoga sp. 50_1627]|uniref:alpha/beta fold hydrolase n=1 Tax=Pseudothermotoga sp. TaxID=2033661 RepID=UPI00076DCBCE|nr:MAG: Inner-membrane translocator [Thermotoga sp. 50_64]KUK25444.1 MAG: Inner-membrane translocator [Thermotoga sp. 50_1627]MBC7115719.1 alpha/beta fold hydrolase [Pseudothermotoga sp.]MDK2923427.1 branched-chain amino acid transport system permease protein [Pseudothermotoga sp.]HCO97701.1 ABC transporter permease [Pseudothermotoga sp.]
MRWLLLLILLSVPFLPSVSGFILTLLNLTFIYSIAAMGLNVIMGYAGQISIGHAAFMSVGAYTSAILVQRFSIPIPVSILIAIVFGAIVGMVLGFPALRLKGFYLAIVTMGFVVAIEQMFGAWETLTGGHIGLRNIKLFGSDTTSYYVNLSFLLVCFYLFRLLVRGKIGRALAAMRENELVARVFGVHLTYHKVVAFSFGSALAALAGALYAHTIGYIAPSLFGLGKSLDLLAMVVIGGLALEIGPFFGATLYTVLPFFFSRSGFSLSIIFGTILILTVLFMPRGIAYHAMNFWLKWAELPLVWLKRRSGKPEGKFVETSFGRLHYVEAGEGIPLICIHGNFGSFRWFKPILGRISNFKTIALDLPNFGFSDRTIPTLDNYVKAVEEFIEKLELNGAIVLAHSLGGAIGMKLALKRPDLLRGLILVDPCPIDGLPTPTENLPYLELYKRNRSVLRRSLYGLLSNVKNRKFVEQLVDDALKMNPEAVYAHADELGKFDLTGQTENYRVKTLLVWGDMDPLLTREQMENTCKALKAQLVVFSNVGHTPFVEVTDDFLKRIEPFLKEVGA